MANTLIIYPYADGTIGHSLSNGSVAYTLINESTNNTTGYIEHTFSGNSTTKSSSFTKLAPVSNNTINKIRINSINSINLYFKETAQATMGGNASITSIDISGSITINSNIYNSEHYTQVSTQNNISQSLNISNATNLNII